MISTISEQYFMKYCQARGYGYEKLDIDKSSKNPDFKIVTKDGEVIFEVKQIELNKDDIKLFDDIMENGGSWSFPIGKRASEKIKEAKKQLKPYSNTNIPLVILLYEDIPEKYPTYLKNPFLIDVHIDSAMFGEAVVYFTLNDKLENFSKGKSDFTFGGNRKITPDCGAYISAVGVLKYIDEKNISISFYHNPYAKTPLYPCYFKDQNDMHFVKPETFRQGWLKYIGSRNTRAC